MESVHLPDFVHEGLHEEISSVDLPNLIQVLPIFESAGVGK